MGLYLYTKGLTMFKTLTAAAVLVGALAFGGTVSADSADREGEPTPAAHDDGLCYVTADDGTMTSTTGYDLAEGPGTTQYGALPCRPWADDCVNGSTRVTLMPCGQPEVATVETPAVRVGLAPVAPVSGPTPVFVEERPVSPIDVDQVAAMVASGSIR